MRAYGRKITFERWDELEGEMSDAAKRSRSVSRLMSQRSSSMIKAEWSGNQEGSQELQVTDVEQQALPRRG
ncbi:hypothetical protein FOA52_005407 [Chlamydomonas sp. UWO 241]|nr:hypothetical protein FOA52_005407 [Chlamydomonas sp. UWO 241]